MSEQIELSKPDAIQELGEAPDENPDEDEDDDLDEDHLTPVRLCQDLDRLMTDDELVPLKNEEWKARVFEPLGDNPGRYGKDVVAGILRASTATKEAIRALQWRDEWLDGLVRLTRQTSGPSDESAVVAVEDGGENDG